MSGKIRAPLSLSNTYAKMKVGHNERGEANGNIWEADIVRSGTLGERAEHYQRTKDAGTLEPSLPLQSTI